MKFKAVLSAVALGAMLMSSASGCDIADFNSDSLLRPPKTMGDEAEIEQLIAETANKGYTLKYPKSGAYRSAIIMHDLDGDGVDEAVAFYREKNDVTKIHMLVMHGSNDKWQLSDDFTTETTDVDSVDFSDINGDGSLEIIVGYTTYTANVNFLSCYSYLGGETEEIKAGQTYSSFYCGDFNSDLKSEVMTLSLYSTENEAKATMLDFEESKNTLYSKASVSMDPNVVRYKNVLVSDLGKNLKGIVIDGAFANEEVNTQIIYYNKEMSLLRNPLYKEKTTSITQRNCPVVSADIDNDLVVEVPTVAKLPRSDKESAETVADKITWNTFDVQNESLAQKSNMIANYSLGYTIKMPDKWLNNTVTAIYNSSDNSTLFYEWKDNSLGTELFEIKVFDVAEWDKGKYTDKYTLIYKDNRYAYTFKNITKDNKYSMTDDEIKTAFSVLNALAV